MLCGLRTSAPHAGPRPEARVEMRQMGLWITQAVRSAVALALCAGVLSGEDLGKGNYAVILTPKDNTYSLTAKEPRSLCATKIPTGVEIDSSSTCVERTLEGRLVRDLVKGCEWRFKVDGTKALQPVTIEAEDRTDEADGAEGQPRRVVTITLAPFEPSINWMNRTQDFLSSQRGLFIVSVVGLALIGLVLWWDTILRAGSALIGLVIPRKQNNERLAPPPAPVNPCAARGEMAATPAISESAPAATAAAKDSLDDVRAACRQIELARGEWESQMDAFLIKCRGAVSEACDKAVEKVNASTANEDERLVRRIAELESKLGSLHDEVQTAATDLLRELPHFALDLNAKPDELDSRPDAMGEAVRRYLQDEQPESASVEKHARAVDTLRESLRRFGGLAKEGVAGQGGGRLNALAKDLNELGEELNRFTPNGTDHRLRLLFAVDFSRGDDVRQTFTQAIAASLHREIVKLNNFDEYYDKRIAMLASQVAAECADLADTELDPRRAGAEVQEALKAVFDAAGVDDLTPRRNERFLATQHAMYQMVRCSKPGDQSGTVCQTIARGLRRGEKVIRKATVIMFE